MADDQKKHEAITGKPAPVNTTPQPLVGAAGSKPSDVDANAEKLKAEQQAKLDEEQGKTVARAFGVSSAEDAAAHAERVEVERKKVNEEIRKAKEENKKRMEELLVEIQVRLDVFNGLEGNIPLSDRYWDAIKEYRSLHLAEKTG